MGAVLGAGPIGLEMAQAFQRFGSKVTVLEAFPRILGPEDEEASKIVHKVLEEDGVREWPEISVTIQRGDSEPEQVVCDCFLVATGRVPNVEGLGLEAAGVEYKAGLGVKVNDDLSTTNPDVYALGDATDQPQLRF